MAEWLGYRPPAARGYRSLRLFTVFSDPLDAFWFANASIELESRYFTVVQGATNTSSWSQPVAAAPLPASTPTTFRFVFLTRIALPTGDSPANSSRAIVCPIRQTCP